MNLVPSICCSRRPTPPEEAAQYLPQAQKWAEQLRGAYYDVQSLADEEARFAGFLDFDPEERERVEARLDELYRLGLKYGRTEEEMLRYLENAKKNCMPLNMPMKNWQNGSRCLKPKRQKRLN